MSSKSIFANTGLCLDLRGRFAAVRRGVLLCKVFSAIVIGAALATSPQVARGDETNETVNVWNDYVYGSPSIVGTNVTWSIDIRNNSNILPEGDPWNEKITSVRLFDLYSSETPVAVYMPHATWSPSFTDNGDDTYTFYATTWFSEDYINPGGKKNLGLRQPSHQQIMY